MQSAVAFVLLDQEGIHFLETLVIDSGKTSQRIA